MRVLTGLSLEIIPIISIHLPTLYSFHGEEQHRTGLPRSMAADGAFGAQLIQRRRLLRLSETRE